MAVGPEISILIEYRFFIIGSCKAEYSSHTHCVQTVAPLLANAQTGAGGGGGRGVGIEQVLGAGQHFVACERAAGDGERPALRLQMQQRFPQSEGWAIACELQLADAVAEALQRVLPAGDF